MLERDIRKEKRRELKRDRMRETEIKRVRARGREGH